MGNGLRLVSVLGVAVIIGIGVAVLRPVLQRAKAVALMDTCMFRMENMGDALLSYVEINDNQLPLAFAHDDKRGGYRWQQVVPYPASWPFTSNEQRISEDICTWANSTLALSRTDRNYWCPSTDIVHMKGVDYRLKRPLPAAMSYTFNGLLHSLPVSKIENREAVILAWEGIGSQTLNGYAIANPTLGCVEARPCRFGSSEARFLMPLASFQAHEDTVVAVMADGHNARLKLDKVFADVADDGSPRSWWAADGSPVAFSPVKGTDAFRSTRFDAIMPPDTEKQLPKRP